MIRPPNYLLSCKKYQYGSCWCSSSQPGPFRELVQFRLVGDRNCSLPRTALLRKQDSARAVPLRKRDSSRTSAQAISGPGVSAPRTIRGSERGCRSASCSRPGARVAPGWCGCRDHRPEGDRDIRRAKAEEGVFVERSCIQVTHDSAHITARLEGHLSRAHHFPHNHAEEAMDSMGNYSAEKPNFARSRAETEPSW